MSWNLAEGGNSNSLQGSPQGLFTGTPWRSWYSRHRFLQPNISFRLVSHLECGRVPCLPEHLEQSFVELGQGGFVSIDPEVGPGHRWWQLLAIVGEQGPQGNSAHHLLEPVGQCLVFSFRQVQEWSREAEG